MSSAIIACVCAWLVPGGGHLYLRKWGRGLIFLGIVLLLFSLGIWMDGNLFSLQAGFFGVLRFFADVSMGLPYIIGKAVGIGHGKVTDFGYEYGNTYLYTAGLINMLLVVDSFDIALGRKK